MMIQGHLNKSEWHCDNAEAEIGYSQVGDKHIPDNLLIGLFLIRMIDKNFNSLAA